MKQKLVLWKHNQDQQIFSLPTKEERLTKLIKLEMKKGVLQRHYWNSDDNLRIFWKPVLQQTESQEEIQGWLIIYKSINIFVINIYYWYINIKYLYK
jgi:hypothetical protein